MSIGKLNKPRNQKPWLPEEVMALKNLSGKMALSEITKKVNLEFGNKRTDGSVKARCHQHSFPLRIIKNA